MWKSIKITETLKLRKLPKLENQNTKNSGFRKHNLSFTRLPFTENGSRFPKFWISKDYKLGLQNLKSLKREYCINRDIWDVAKNDEIRQTIKNHLDTKIPGNYGKMENKPAIRQIPPKIMQNGKRKIPLLGKFRFQWVIPIPLPDSRIFSTA